MCWRTLNSFYLIYSEKCPLKKHNSCYLIVKSKLSPLSGYVALWQLKTIHKKWQESFVCFFNLTNILAQGLYVSSIFADHHIKICDFNIAFSKYGNKYP